MPLKKNPRERFGEKIGCHIFGGNVKEGQGFGRNALAHVVIVSVNVFCSIVMFRVLGESFGSSVVNMNR